MEMSKTTSDPIKLKHSTQVNPRLVNRPDDETTRKQVSHFNQVKSTSIKKNSYFCFVFCFFFSKFKIIKMLICIVVIFFICWAPITINNLLVSFRVLPNVNVGIFWHLRLVFYILSFINRFPFPHKLALLIHRCIL